MDNRNISGQLEGFFRAAETIINNEAKQWMEQGNKVVGYFCSSMPEEIVTAAGMLPFRIRGTGNIGTDFADAFFSSLNCSFPRHSFNLALKGEYDFLEGLLMFNSCDVLRRTYDHWIRQIKTPFVKLLTLPKKADPPQIEFFGEELVVLKQQIEEHFGVEITDDRLRGAIKLHNETRSLLRKLYDLRKSDYPPVSGAETLAITVASTAMPKSRFNELLKQLLTELSDKECIKDYRARLMIIGSELDDPKYLEAIESQGGLIVTDSLCFGSRLIFSGVDENAKDPLKALAQYYLADRPSCPHICTEYKSRNEYVMNMIRDYKVDGVILERLAFCDLWGFEGYLLDGDFKNIKLPFLSVEREYNQSSIGQLRTRVQALLETMED